MTLLTRTGLRIIALIDIVLWPIFHFFSKWRPFAILVFQKLEILTTAPVRKPNMCHHTKYCEDRSNRSGNMADFRFSRWRPSANLDLFYACWDHPRRVFGGLYDCAKFGCNRRSNFDSRPMQISILSLKMPIHPQNRFFWDFTPKMGSSMNETPDRHILGRKHVI